MAALAIQSVVMTGLQPTLVAAAGGGDTFVNENGDVVLYVKNDDGTATTVTFTSPATVRGLAVADPSGDVAAGNIKIYGPFDPALFNAAAGTGVAVTYSKVTSLTVAAIKVPRYY